MAGLRPDLVDPKAVAENYLDVDAARPNEFVKGVKSFAYGSGSGLRNVAGLVGEQAGFNEFAQEQYQEADRLAQRASEVGPRVSSFSQLRDGGFQPYDVSSYVGGILGGALPSAGIGLAAGILSGGAAIPALAAGTAAYAPLETGDAIAKFRNANPGQAIDGSTALRLAGTGVASAAAQSVVPAIVGGKVLGKFASAPTTSLKSAALRNIPESVLLEGGTEALGETIKQYGANPDRALDTDQILESGIAGAIGGAPFAGVGTASDYLRGNAQNLSNLGSKASGLASSAADKAKSKLDGLRGGPESSAGDGAGFPTGQPPGTPPGAPGAPSGDAPKAGFGDVWEALKQTGESALKGFSESDLGVAGVERVTKMRERADAILNDPDVPTEWKSRVEAAVKGMGNTANASIVAAVDKARQTANTLRQEDGFKKTIDGLRPNVDAVINGDYFGNKADLNGTSEQIKSKLAEGASKAAAAAQTWGQDLMRRADVSDETKARVQEALANVGDQANQAFIASKWKMQDGAESLVKKAQDFVSKVRAARKGGVVDVDSRVVPDKPGLSKKSEDYEGVRRVIGETLRPYMTEINEVVGNDRKKLASVGEAIRAYMEGITSDAESFDAVDRGFARMTMIELLGNKAPQIMGDISEALGTGQNRQQAERFFTELSELQSLQRSRDGVVKLMMKGKQPSEFDAVMADLERLQKSATADLTGKSQAEIRFINERMQADLESKYGTRGKAILSAVEKMLAPKADLLAEDNVGGGIKSADDAVDEFDNGTTVKSAGEVEERQYYGSGIGNRTLVENPAVRASSNPEFAGRTTGDDLIKRLKAENPDADVRFVSIAERPEIYERSGEEKKLLRTEAKRLEKELPGVKNAQARADALNEFRENRIEVLKQQSMGAVEVSRVPNGKLSKDEIDNARMDTAKYGSTDNPSRLEIKPQGAEKATDVFDAVALTKMITQRINRERTWTVGDDKNALTRMGRAFADGVAMLTEQYGRFRVPGETVVGYINGKAITAARALKADKRTSQDRENDANTVREVDLTKEFDGLLKARSKATADGDKAGVKALSEQIKAVTSELSGLRRGKESRVANDLAGKTVEDLDAALRSIDAKLIEETDLTTRRALERERDYIEDRIDSELERNNVERGLTDKAREDADPNGNISVAGQRLGASELQARTNVDGSLKSTPSTYAPNAKPLVITAGRIAEAGGIGETIANRILKLAQNFAALSERDQKRLLDVQDTTKPSDVGPLVNELARKYAGGIVAPGKPGLPPIQAKKAAPVDETKPFTPAQVDKAILNEKWPTTVKEVEEFLKAARTRYDELSDLRDRSFKDDDVEYSDDSHDAYRALLETFEPTTDLAMNFTEADGFNDLPEAEQDRLIAFAESLNDGVYKRPKPEGTPDPKAVAAKKAAFLEKAVSGDKALISELKASTDVKGLQRALKALNETTSGPTTSTGIVAPSRAQNLGKQFAAALVNGDATADEANLLNAIGGELLKSEGSVEAVLTNLKFAAQMEVLATMARNGDYYAEALRHSIVANLERMAEPGAGARADKMLQALYASESTKPTKGLSFRDIADVFADSPARLEVIAKLINKLSPTTKVRFNGTDPNIAFFGAQAVYYNDSDTIIIGPDADAKALLHEGVHAATIKAVANNTELHRALRDLMEHVAKENPKVQGVYGLTNALEFLAEGLTSAHLQAILRNTKPSSAVEKFLGSEFANAWDALTALLRKVLDIKPADANAFTQFIELSSQALNENDGLVASKTDLETITKQRLVPKEEGDRLIAELRQYTSGANSAFLDSKVSDSEYTQSDLVFFESALALMEQYRPDQRSQVSLKGLERTVRAFAGAKAISSAKKPNIERVKDVITERLGKLLKDDAAAYQAQTTKYSYESVSDTGKTNEPDSAAAIRDYIKKVLGPNVKVEFSNIMYAGEFTQKDGDDIIRLSIHALNPTSTAYHEALHGFFQQLREKGLPDVVNAVYKGINSPFVMKQLRERLKNSPEALAQLSVAEERAAYAFQFWATDPTFKLRPEANTVFEKIAQAIRNVLGMWSNEQRAEEIFKYFHSGKYQTQSGSKLAVHTATMRAGRNASLDTLAQLTGPIKNLGDVLVGAGSERLRDTGIPALRDLADLIKLKGTDQGKDPGYIQSARIKRTEYMNWLATNLREYSPADLNEALEAMQGGTKANGVKARAVQRIVQKEFLRKQMLDDYLPNAGVKVRDLGEDYFPRTWDPQVIAQNQEKFIEMLESYGVKNPDTVLEKIISGAGTELGFDNEQIVIERPGFVNARERKLAFISGEDASPFLRKDFWKALDSYTTQATRRGEWSRRFGFDNEGFDALLAEAREQGATPAQLKLASDYAKAVDGTLGDDIDPSWRLLQGNVIVYQNLRLLPLAIFSSAVDPLGILVRGGTVREAWDTFKRGIRELRKSWQNDPTFDSDTEFAAQVGTIEDAMLQHTISSLYGQGMMGDTAQKVNDLFFRYNFMEGFNRSMRVGATTAAANFIIRHATKPNKHSERYLAELGLTAADVSVDADGKLVITDRTKVALNRWVDGAVLRPDAADTAIWLHDPHFAVFAHLKQFAFAFHHTFLKRVWHEYQHGNYKPAMALGSFVPVMMASDLIKDILTNGGDEPEWKRGWTLMDHVGYGVERAGLLGVGQFALDGLGDLKHGGSGIGALAGPTVDQLGDALSVFGGRKSFESFALRSLPANSLYRGYVSGGQNAGEVESENDAVN